jgi:hypothetical protein
MPTKNRCEVAVHAKFTFRGAAIRRHANCISNAGTKTTPFLPNLSTTGGVFYINVKMRHANCDLAWLFFFMKLARCGSQSIKSGFYVGYEKFVLWRPLAINVSEFGIIQQGG